MVPRSFLPIVLVLLLAGCLDDYGVDVEFARVEEGMSRAEVTALLGAPTARQRAPLTEERAALLRLAGRAEALEEWTWGGCGSGDLGRLQRVVRFGGGPDEPTATWRVVQKYEWVCGTSDPFPLPPSPAGAASPPLQPTQGSAALPRSTAGAYLASRRR